jgi:hypothetical protein
MRKPHCSGKKQGTENAKLVPLLAHYEDKLNMMIVRRLYQTEMLNINKRTNKQSYNDVILDKQSHILIHAVRSPKVMRFGNHRCRLIHTTLVPQTDLLFSTKTSIRKLFTLLSVTRLSPSCLPPSSSYDVSSSVPGYHHPDHQTCNSHQSDWLKTSRN